MTRTPGTTTLERDVYLGTNADDVSKAGVDNPLGVLRRAGHDANSFDPGRLELGTTYYWRVDEVNGPPDHTVYEGDIWTFMTEPFKEIWAAWLDGTEFGTDDPTNGSIVGRNPAMGDYSAAPGRNGGQSLPQAIRCPGRAIDR